MKKTALLIPLLLSSPLLTAQSGAPAKAGAVALQPEATKLNLTVLQQTPSQDLDGDGKPDVAAACKNENGEVVVAFFKMTGGRPAHAWTSPSTGADEVKLFELRNMVADKRPEVVMEAQEHSPGEIRRQFRVYRGDERGFRDVLFISFEEKPSEVRLDRITFGDDEPGYRVTDLEGDGNQEVMIKREPKPVLKVKGKGGSPVTLVLGVGESVYAWDAAGGAYQQRPDHHVNFLPALKITRVTASSQKVDKALLNSENNRALEASLTQALDEQKAAANDDPAPVEFNPAPRAVWGADNDLNTSWVENAKGDGTGEFLNVELGSRQDLHMVRVIPVCAKDEADAKNHNEITAFSLLLSGAEKVSVDRAEKEPSDGNVVAVVEIPAPERKFAKQVLVFLQKGTKSSSVRLVIDKVKKRGKGNDACIAELSVH